MESGNKEFKFIAFISYNHEDIKWAKWLQKKLESYKIPTELKKENSTLPKKISPIFRDQSDLSGGTLKEEIEKALSESKFLIVICSPRASKSPWVSKEAQYFIDHGREKFIIPFIIDGSPNAVNPDEECFPKALRKLTDEKELLGISLQEHGREAALIKVISQLLSLRFDTLWKRFERQRKKRIFQTIIGLSLLLLIIIGVLIYILSQNQKLYISINRAVSHKMMELIEDGNVLTARKVVLELLDQPTRPFSSELEWVIRQSFEGYMVKYPLSNFELQSLEFLDSVTLVLNDSKGTALFDIQDETISLNPQISVSSVKNDTLFVYNEEYNQIAKYDKENDLFIPLSNDSDSIDLLNFGLKLSSQSRDEKWSLYQFNDSSLKKNTNLSDISNNKKYSYFITDYNQISVMDNETGNIIHKNTFGKAVITHVAHSQKFSKNGLDYYYNNFDTIFYYHNGYSKKIYERSDSYVEIIKENPEGSMVAIGYLDGTLLILDEEGKLQNEFKIPQLKDLCWGNNSEELYAMSKWSLFKIYPRPRDYILHDVGSPYSLDYNLSNSVLFYDNRNRILKQHMIDNDWETVYEFPNEFSVHDIELSNSGDILLFYLYSGNDKLNDGWRLLDLVKNEIHDVYIEKDSKKRFKAFVLGFIGDNILAMDDQIIYLFTDQGDINKVYPIKDQCISVNFQKDRIIILTTKELVRLDSELKEKQIFKLPRTIHGDINPSGRYVINKDAKSIFIYDIENSRDYSVEVTNRQKDTELFYAFFKNENKIVIISEDGLLTLYDLDSETKLLERKLFNTDNISIFDIKVVEDRYVIVTTTNATYFTEIEPLDDLIRKAREQSRKLPLSAGERRIYYLD
ncbi:MAG: toll/interleukin-1 receptor domain-containing protein [Muribaculaceae bacterium]|nr:toll/interleukin-1 receptor domain-containing protein [Muribaculaceae bacterium]